MRPASSAPLKATRTSWSARTARHTPPHQRDAACARPSHSQAEAGSHYNGTLLPARLRWLRSSLPRPVVAVALDVWFLACYWMPVWALLSFFSAGRTPRRSCWKGIAYEFQLFCHWSEVMVVCLLGEPEWRHMFRVAQHRHPLLANLQAAYSAAPASMDPGGPLQRGVQQPTADAQQVPASVCESARRLLACADLPNGQVRGWRFEAVLAGGLQGVAHGAGCAGSMHTLPRTAQCCLVMRWPVHGSWSGLTARLAAGWPRPC